MGGIPLPALSIKPPEDPTQGIERAVALRNLLQNAPIQHQILQQQAQAGAQENQLRQQQIADQQASTKAWQNWDGKNPDDLIHGILSNGGSGAAANQLAQQLMARQQQHLQLSESEFALEQKKTDRMLGRLTAAESVPDDQLAAHAKSAIDQSVQSGDLDPQQAQMGYQLLQQSGNDPKALRAGFDTFRKGYMLDSQIASRAKEEAETRKNNAQAAKDEQEAAFYKNTGLAPGVTPDMAAYAAYLGKGGKPEGWAGYKAGQEAAATQPYKIETAKVEAQTKQLLEGYTRPGYAFNPATGQTQLTNQSDYLRSGGQLQAFRPVTEKEVSGDAMLINRLGDVHQKLTEYEQALQKPVSPADKRNMAALLGTDVRALGGTSIGGIHIGGTIPMDRINQVFDSGALNDLSSNARDQLVAYRNMREALVGYKTVLSGSSRGSDKQMELLDQAIPIPSITNADYSTRALNAFRGNLRVVGQGLPTLPGIKSPQQIEQEVQGNSNNLPQINGRLSDLLNMNMNTR